MKEGGGRIKYTERATNSVKAPLALTAPVTVICLIVSDGPAANGIGQQGGNGRRAARPRLDRSNIFSPSVLFH